MGADMTLSAESLPIDTHPVGVQPIPCNDDVVPEVFAASDAPAAPGKATRYCVVVNANAGSSSGFAEDAIRQAAPDATFEVKTVGPDDLNAAFDWAFGEKPAAVIVVGGDGTARTAAVRAVDTGVPIIPMPGGTMNVLPKIIFGHGDLARAIRELPHLKPRGLDVGVVSGEMFFLSAAFGFAGPMTRLREATRSDNKLTRISEAGRALLRNIGPSLQCRVSWRTPNNKWRNAHSLIVAIGDLDRILTPDTEDHGHRFEVAALNLRSVWQMLSFGAAFLAGAWRDSPRLKIARAGQVEVRLPSKRPLVVLDGEPMRLSRVSEVSLRLGALPVLALPSDFQSPEAPPATGKA
jgi:diacylglycerol kinase family enzyme